MKSEMAEVRVDCVNVGKRFREVKPDDADVIDLANDMKGLAQLQTIAVIRNGQYFDLIEGARRLAAAKRLGWLKIKAIVFDLAATDDARLFLRRGEQSADIHQKPWTMEQRAKLAKAITEYMEERRGRAPSIPGVAQNVGKLPTFESADAEIPSSVVLPVPEAGQKTRDAVASAVGFKNETEMRRVQAVVASGDRPTIDALNAGTISPSKAASQVSGKVKSAVDPMKLHKDRLGAAYRSAMDIKYKDHVQRLKDMLDEMTQSLAAK